MFSEKAFTRSKMPLFPAKHFLISFEGQCVHFFHCVFTQRVAVVKILLMSRAESKHFIFLRNIQGCFMSYGVSCLIVLLVHYEP